MPEAPAFFEDFIPGQRFEGGAHTVTAADLQAMTTVSGDRSALHTDGAFAASAGFPAPLLHAPFGLAAFLGWFFELGIARDSVVAMLDSHWRYRAPVVVGDVLRFEMTVTRCRRTSAGDKGVVGRHVRIRNAAGTVVQEGTTALLVRARGPGAQPAREFFTRPWAALLGERLNASAAFRSATATWDGAFALACGEDEAHFRVFRGTVIEAGPRSPNGPLFTVGADELTWAELFTGPANDMMPRAMHGAFAVRGAAYEYLRLTKALNIAVDEIRALFRSEARP